MKGDREGGGEEVGGGVSGRVWARVCLGCVEEGDGVQKAERADVTGDREGGGEEVGVVERRWGVL